MTWRAIIADDEEKILQLILMLGHWEQYGIEIIDRCTNGREALSSILKNRPDFVISDIKMPEVDGLQLIEETRKAGLDSLFILLSGYRYFEYARSAVSLNAVDYLLKPVNEEQLNEALKKTCHILEEKILMRKEQDEFRQMKLLQEKAKQDEFWHVLIHPDEGSDYASKFISRQMLNSSYNFEFAHECWQIVFLTTNIYRMVPSENTMTDEEICRRFGLCLSRNAVMYYLRNHFGYNIILNFRKEDAAAVREGISALFYSVRDLQEIYGKFTLHLGVSDVHDNPKELKEAFVEARAAEWGRFTVRFDTVLFYWQVRDMEKVPAETILSNELTEQAAACVKYQRKEELADVFEQIHNIFIRADQYHPGSVSEAYFHLIDEATKAAPAEKRNVFSEGIDSAFSSSGDYSKLIRNTYAAMAKFLDEESRNVSAKNRKPITEAVYYISRHFNEPISQADVAEACGISTAYMSRLFKEEMQIGFQDYLTKVRIEQAEKMLRETNRPVKEIAVAVGYPDEKYFSKVYKKQTGIKPSDYRKIYG